MNLTENINLAIRSIRANLLRAVLTLLIIAFGIMALVGILTAIDSAIFALNDNFSSLGANSFNIRPSRTEINSRQGGRQIKRGEPISLDEALDFKERYDFPARTAISFGTSSNAVVRYAKEETNPTISVLAGDEDYLAVSGTNLQAGRGFTLRESKYGSNLAIIGADIVKTLFEGKTRNALDKVISVGNIKYKVIGVLEDKGSTAGQSEGNRVIIPLQTGKRYYSTDNTNYSIVVAVNEATQMDAAVSNAIGLMRRVRKLKAAEDNDFEIRKSDSLIETIRENTVYLRLAAVMIGLITLIGAAIGLMNIMLVSVTERTREVGISKAVGANRRHILVQFLTEAVVISLMGGLVGIVLGVGVGNIVTLLLGGTFLVPWTWIVMAILTTTIVGLISGLYPALKAAQLDPIESLRYE